MKFAATKNVTTRCLTAVPGSSSLVNDLLPPLGPLSANFTGSLVPENISLECRLSARLRPLTDVNFSLSKATTALEKLRDIDSSDVNAIDYGEVRP